MSLVDLKTNLKTLKYSQFDTKDPYVTKDIINPIPYRSVNSQLSARSDDLERITKVVASNPKFSINQTALRTVQAQNDLKKAATSGNFRSIGNTLLDAATGTTRAIGSLLNQIPVAGTGTHYIYEQKDDGTGTYLGKIGGPLSLIGNTVSDYDVKSEKIGQVDPNNNVRIAKQVRPGFGSLEGNPNNPATVYKQLSNDAEKVESINVVLKNKLNIENRTFNKLSQTPNNISVQTERYPEFDQFDTLPFEIGIINPVGNDPTSGFNVSISNTETPSDFLYFTAYLQSLNDTFGSNWNESTFIGRADPVYNYSTFKRTIEFSFFLAAQNQDELKPLYNKLNYLLSSTAPGYGPANSAFKIGIFSTLTLGDYFKNEYGFFNNIGLAWDLNYPWEVGVKVDDNGFSSETLDNSLPKLPHVLNVNCSFTPIYRELPEYKSYFVGDSKLLADE